MAAASASGDWFLVQGAPAVAQWTGEAGVVKRLGCDPPCQVSAFIGTHASRGTAFFSLRVPVGLKETGKNKTVLHLFVYPEQVVRMRVHGYKEHPAPVLNTLVGKIEQYGSAKDIIGLEFSLQRPATLIGPANKAALSSKTKAIESVLAALRSLIHASSITFFVPRNGNSMSKIQALCNEACNGGLKASATEYSLAMLYGGSGGQDVRSLLARFDPEESEGPPSYDELALTPPPMRQKKRMPSSRISPPPAKRYASAIEPRLSAASEARALKQQMAGLVAEVAELRGRIGTQGAACSETEDTSVTARLNSIETVVSSLKMRVEEMETALQGRSAGREQSVERQIIEKFEEQLDERIDEVRGETRGEVNYQLDEMLTDIKAELSDWAQEELRDLVSQQLGELVEEYLANASFTVERHSSY